LMVFHFALADLMGRKGNCRLTLERSQCWLTCHTDFKKMDTLWL
jgi:hypothetical protein